MQRNAIQLGQDTGISRMIGQRIKLYLGQNDELPNTGLLANREVGVYSSRIEDAEADSIVIAWPTDRGVQVPVETGQLVFLRIPCERGLVQIESRITARRVHPIPLLHVKAVNSSSLCQLRYHVRLDVIINPVESYWLGQGLGREHATVPEGLGAEPPTANANGDNGEPFDAIIRDLSAGGLRLGSARRLDTGDAIAITFPLGTVRREISAKARVVWTGEDGSSKRFRCKAGCQFIDLGMKHEDSITKFIFAKQLELRRAGLL